MEYTVADESGKNNTPQACELALQRQNEIETCHSEIRQDRDIMSVGAFPNTARSEFLIWRDSNPNVQLPSNHHSPTIPKCAREGKERPQSGRRTRPSERALSGLDRAAKWPAIGKALEGDLFSAESNKATTGGSAHDDEVMQLEDELHDQPGLGANQSGDNEKVHLHQLQENNAQKEDSSDQKASCRTQALFSERLSKFEGQSQRLSKDKLAELEIAFDGAKYSLDCVRIDHHERKGDAQPTIRRRYFSGHTSSQVRHFEILLSGTQPDSGARDYLTWYYCDFMEAEVVGPAPPFQNDNTTTVDELVAWLEEFKPRTRMDAYPMLQVAIAALNKLVQREVHMRNQQAETLIRLM
jgi:hypothetical protein